MSIDAAMFDERIVKHLDMVLQINETTNLTSIRSRQEGLLLHVEDSLQGLDEINVAPEGPYADLGTGGGYPGIPLAIMTGRKTTLVDSVKKKTECLDAVIRELKIDNSVETYWGRIEDLAKERAGYYAVVTARALSQLRSLMELSAPLLKYKGHLICYKAKVSEDEMSSALSLEQVLGLKLVSQREFLLSDEATARCLIVFEKVNEPTVKLPRKAGFAQKKPLNA